jgi:hypothetical protein
MFHNDDVVEEVATGRRGVVDSIGSSVSCNVVTQNNWRVRFADEKEPLVKIFTKLEDFILVECLHQREAPSGFYPSDPIM